MSFINCEERDADGFYRFEKAAAAKALRRDVDELKLTSAQGVDA